MAKQSGLRDNLGKGIGTASVWGGVALLSYIFSLSGILTSEGAGLMVLVALLSTAAIWG